MSARWPSSSWLRPRSCLACRMARPRWTTFQPAELAHLSTGLDRRWDPSLFRQAESGVQVNAEGKRVVRRQPIYQPEDPNCCPTGGTAIDVYVYRSGRFEAIEQYSEPPNESQSATSENSATDSSSSTSETKGESDESDESDAGKDCQYNAPYFDPSYCATEEEIQQENETEAECGAYDPSRETADGDYVPKPGC